MQEVTGMGLQVHKKEHVDCDVGRVQWVQESSVPAHTCVCVPLFAGKALVYSVTDAAQVKCLHSTKAIEAFSCK